MIKKIKVFSTTCILISGLCTVSAARAEIFEATATSGGDYSTQKFTSVGDLLDTATSDYLSSSLPSYTQTSVASIVLNVRGLPAVYQYEDASTTLTFEVPSLGISEQWTGATRDDSEQLGDDYLEKNGSGILTRMLQAMVATTPTDPVAGNPNSLMAQMGVSDFGMGTDFNFGPAGAPHSVSKDSANSSAVSIGTSAGRFSAGDYDHDIFTIPIEYTHYMEDPRQQLRISAPLTYLDTEGSESYNGSLGLGYRFPVINDDWSLTPSLRVGYLYSDDLGSAAIVYSGSIASNYNLYYDDLKISVGNMLSYYTTESIDVNDYELDYDLTNQMTKNGIGFEGSTGGQLLQQPTSWQFAVAHTYFWGDELYIDSYFDFGVSWGTRDTDAHNSMNSMRFGLTYTYANEGDYDGLRLNFGFTF